MPTTAKDTAIALACALTHTQLDETARKFSKLQEGAPQGTPAPQEEDVQAWLADRLREVAQKETLSAWRKAYLAQQVQETVVSLLPAGLPSASEWYAWLGIVEACETTQVHRWFTGQSNTRLPLAEQSPQEIDEELSRLWGLVQREIDRKRRIVYLINQFSRVRDGKENTRLAQAKQDLEAVEAKIVSLVDQTEPYEREYLRRGGWSRFFRVVTSGSGHVHRSRDCHSCYPTTLYIWLPALSGKGEVEAVELYGKEMCSHCFPAVLSHPSYRTHGSLAEEAAQRRAEKDAAREALRELKGITGKDGGVLKIGVGYSNYPESFFTKISAERKLISRLVDLNSELLASTIAEEVEKFAQERGESWISAEQYKTNLYQRRNQYEQDVEVLAEALARKAGLTEKELLARYQGKVAVKARAILRKRASRV